jgi:DNA-binding transcriptional regulator YdaS (Cro superfamily)
MSRKALIRACKIAGGQKPLADRIGTTQGQVWYWLEKSKKGVAAEFVLTIERETGVSRSELRPDLYPLEKRGSG